MDYLLHHLSSLTRILSFRRVEFWRFRQVWRPKLLKNLISQRRKGPTKILLYSLECLLQKRKNGTVCKVLLTSKHLEISSSKKNFTSVHFTPSWNGKDWIWNWQSTQYFYWPCSPLSIQNTMSTHFSITEVRLNSCPPANFWYLKISRANFDITWVFNTEVTRTWASQSKILLLTFGTSGGVAVGRR